MADRTSARLFGAIFRVLADIHRRDDAVNPRVLAHEFLMMAANYDFHPHQMDADDALFALGLAWEDDEEVIHYEGEDAG